MIPGPMDHLKSGRKPLAGGGPIAERDARLMEVSWLRHTRFGAARSPCWVVD